MTDDLHISADELRMALANHGARQTNASWQALAIACGRAAAAIDALRSQNPAIKRMACDQCKARNEMCDECFETWREQHLDALRSPPADVGERGWMEMSDIREAAREIVAAWEIGGIDPAGYMLDAGLTDAQVATATKGMEIALRALAETAKGDE